MNGTWTKPQWLESPANTGEARAIQEALRPKLRIKDEFGALNLIAGVDCSYDVANNMSRAFIVLIPLATLIPVESVKAELPTSFPYVPGFLSFREIPVIAKALGLLQRSPDLLMVDGQGIAHPRRMGIAAHLGVLCDLPAIGVAKSRLTGKYVEPGARKGDKSLLLDKGERIGTVLRSKEKTNPLFISPGHRVSHETAVELVLRCLMRYRLPEPTRIADKLSKMKDNGETLL